MCERKSNLSKDSSILAITDEINEKAADWRYIISDVVCREGEREYQFVDLVMEGGGTLGIAPRKQAPKRERRGQARTIRGAALRCPPSLRGL